MKYLFFDFETTGISTATEKVIEIAAIVYDTEKDENISTFQTFIDPQKDISPFITGLTGITNAMVKNQPTEQRAFELFAEFIIGSECDFLAGHNIDAFDLRWLKHRDGLYSLGLNHDTPSLDTLKMARELGKQGVFEGYNYKTPKGAVSFKLENLIDYFQLGSQSHRAIDDVIKNINVYRNFVKLSKTNTSLGF